MEKIHDWEKIVATLTAVPLITNIEVSAKTRVAISRLTAFSSQTQNEAEVEIYFEPSSLPENVRKVIFKLLSGLKRIRFRHVRVEAEQKEDGFVCKVRFDLLPAEKLGLGIVAFSRLIIEKFGVRDQDGLPLSEAYLTKEVSFSQVKDRWQKKVTIFTAVPWTTNIKASLQLKDDTLVKVSRVSAFQLPSQNKVELEVGFQEALSLPAAVNDEIFTTLKQLMAGRESDRRKVRVTRKEQGLIYIIRFNILPPETADQSITFMVNLIMKNFGISPAGRSVFLSEVKVVEETFVYLGEVDGQSKWSLVPAAVIK